MNLIPRARASSWLATVLAAAVLTACAARQPAPQPSTAVEATFDGKPVSYWTEALNSPDAKARVAAASAIAKIGPRAKSAVPALIDALKDDDKLVRTESIAALGKIGPAAAAAVPMLSKLAADNDWATQSLSAAAIAAIQGKSSSDEDAPNASRRAKPRKARRTP